MQSQQQSPVPIDSFFLDETIQMDQTQEGSTEVSPQTNDQQSFFLDEPTETPPKEGVLGFGARTTARTGSRVAETLLGLPGDLRDFAGFLGDSIAGGIRSLTGAKELTPEQKQANMERFLAPEEFGLANRVQVEADKPVDAPFGFLPTSEELKQKSEEATGGYTAAQSRAEKISDNIVSDFTALAIPVKGKIPFARSIGTSVFANLGSEGIKEIGGGEKGAAAGKLGLMVMAGLVGRPNAKQLSRDLYKQSVGAIPEEAAISTKNMQNQITKLQKELLKGGTSPQKQPTMNLLKELNGKITDGKISVQELPAFRQSINDFRFDRTLGDRARYFLDRFEDVIQSGLKDYGEINPQFAKVYRDANIAHAGLKQSNKIANNISKRIKIDRLDPHTISLLGHGAIGAAAGSGFGTIPALGGAAAAAMGYRTLSRLNNPVLRKHYESLLKAAVKDNAAGIVRNTNLLDKAVKKDLQESPPNTQDFEFFSN